MRSSCASLGIWICACARRSCGSAQTVPAATTRSGSVNRRMPCESNVMCSSLKEARPRILHPGPAWEHGPAITDEEAQDVAVDAYVYFYPLVTMDVTRKQLTNLEPGKVPGRG